jgi:transcriptional regulator with XRE-family HTH domain
VNDVEEFTGEQLKQKRLALLLTQQELAKKLGVRRATIVDWEQSRHIPQLYHRRRMRTLFKRVTR